MDFLQAQHTDTESRFKASRAMTHKKSAKAQHYTQDEALHNRSFTLSLIHI